jgi:ABC-type lipoprotein release transport system permease subunit
MALGADALGVQWAVVREGVLQTLLGAAVGLAGAVAVGRTLESLLYGVEPHDGTALVGAALLLPLVAALAAYLPARRASRLDPAEVLRNE